MCYLKEMLRESKMDINSVDMVTVNANIKNIAVRIFCCIIHY